MKNLFIPNKRNNYKPILLRKVALIIYTIILTFVNTFGGVLGIPQAMASNITPDSIIQLTNNERAAFGLNSLSSNSKLAAAALAKANNMFELQYWDHFGPNGETPWMFISQAGYAYVYAGENLAKGFRTAEGVHEAWMASPTHKANIMSGNYKDIGVAVVEGNLLGKDTVLVVQMFGNLTTQTFTPSVKEETAPPTPQTTPTPKPVVRENGEIKSIRITAPANGELIQDANINVKGETENVSGEYSVEILNVDGVIGETSSNSNTWEFEKGSDWEEGVQNIHAQIKGESTKSDVVSFTIDSTPPLIDKSTLMVKQSEIEYTLELSYPSDTVLLQLVSGGKTFDLELSEGGVTSITIPVTQIGDTSVLMASDIAGNISNLDISEYFLEGESETTDLNYTLWIKNILGTTDGISIIIISFIFVLLSIQIYVFWKKGKLGKSIGELFTVGAWWLIILVGVFRGFGGIIN